MEDQIGTSGLIGPIRSMRDLKRGCFDKITVDFLYLFFDLLSEGKIEQTSLTCSFHRLAQTFCQSFSLHKRFPALNR